jgi:signal transduction histidine kinase
MQAREKEFFRKDGGRVPVLIGAACFEGQSRQGVAYILDLTERKRAEAAQMRAEEALRQASDELAKATQAASLAELSASIAHEVNQPLAAVVANSHACHRWLSTEPPNIERAKITVERITRDANSAADVVSRIRALFRRAPHAKSPEDVNRLISEVCRLMTDKIATQDIRIETNLEADLPPVALDRVQVQQVLVNLIRNGIEAMDAVVDGTRALRIRSCRDGLDAIRIEVRDAGRGFKDAERAFEPFFTTKQHGMGMGLTICRSIIEAHGGRLWMGNNETRGATVTFTLPLTASEAPQAREASVFVDGVVSVRIGGASGLDEVTVPMGASRPGDGGERGAASPSEVLIDEHREPPGGGEAEQIGRSHRRGPTPAAVERGGEAEQVGIEKW